MEPQIGKSYKPICFFTHLRKPQVDLKCGTTKKHWFLNHSRAPQRNLNSENVINLKVFTHLRKPQWTSTEPQRNLKRKTVINIYIF